MLQNQSVTLPPVNLVSQAQLFLFSPREFVQHFHRSHEFNFRPAVMESIIENLIRHPTAVNNVERSMINCPDMNQAIIPSANGFEMNTSCYSNNWTFCLLADVADHSTSLCSTRYVTIGICLQEPVANRGIASQTPESHLNPNCGLMVTKQVVINNHQTLGASGPTIRHKTISDVNMVAYDEQVFADPRITGQDYHMMLPGDTARAVAVDEFNDVISMVDSSLALNVKRFGKISAPIESPKRHMRELINGLDSEMTNLLFRDGMGEYGMSSGGLDDYSTQFTANVPNAYDSFSQTSQIYQNRSGILTDQYPLLSSILAQFNPKVNLVQIPPKTNAEILPQNLTSPTTIYSSLVCAILPAHLNAVNLSAVSFMYNSWSDATQVHHIESAIACDQTQLEFMWKKLDIILRSELYPILKSSCGEFDLQVMCSIKDTTDCVLNFYDFEPLPAGVIYQENSILGGMISPLLGTTNTLIQNGFHLNNMIRTVSENINNNNPNIY